jgi:hypothetical protein
MIRSFVNARLEQVFFRTRTTSTGASSRSCLVAKSEKHSGVSRRIPAERQLPVHFERLVNQPEPVLRGICDFLEIEYVSEMATPYQGSSNE